MIKEIQKRFPILKNDLVFLDNAATTQKPQNVINSISEYYSNFNSNVNRGIYPLAEESTRIFEESRKSVADFIKAKSKEIIFSSGATEAMNGLIRSLFVTGYINENSKILVSELEHNSSLLPIRSISKNITYLKLDENYNPIYKDEEFDLAIFPHVSNVTGTIFVPSKINSKIKILDATQSIGHMNIDVNNLGVDFLIFSGHKMYGPMGIGCIYGKPDYVEKLVPFNFGGGTVSSVTKEKVEFKDYPEKFEAGTPNVAGAYGLNKAIEFINDIGILNITDHENEIGGFALSELNKIDNITLYHQENGAGVISFNVNGIHPHDIAGFLGENNICVRAGHHCAHIFHREVLKIPASVRLSLAVYNSRDDVVAFISRLNKAIDLYS